MPFQNGNITSLCTATIKSLWKLQWLLKWQPQRHRLVSAVSKVSAWRPLQLVKLVICLIGDAIGKRVFWDGSLPVLNSSDCNEKGEGWISLGTGKCYQNQFYKWKRGKKSFLLVSSLMHDIIFSWMCAFRNKQIIHLSFWKQTWLYNIPFFFCYPRSEKWAKNQFFEPFFCNYIIFISIFFFSCSIIEQLIDWNVQSAANCIFQLYSAIHSVNTVKKGFEKYNAVMKIGNQDLPVAIKLEKKFERVLSSASKYLSTAELEPFNMTLKTITYFI